MSSQASRTEERGTAQVPGPSGYGRELDGRHFDFTVFASYAPIRRIRLSIWSATSLIFRSAQRKTPVGA